MTRAPPLDRPPRLLLQAPADPPRRLEARWFPDPPPPLGRGLPNGGRLVVDEARPDLIWKFSPWEKSELAFNEVDVYGRLQALEDPPEAVRLEGIANTKDHFIRVMERARSGALDGALRAGALQTPIRALLAPVAAAMARLHAAGLVHRDLKAENLLVFDGRVKLADFDRAAALPEDGRLREPVGSLFHMAPELLTHQACGREIDVYAFGILLFEAAHGGIRAYEGVATGMPGSLTRAEFADKVVNEDLRPLWRSGDEALRDLAARCWAADPGERPQFAEIAEALGAASRNPLRNPPPRGLPGLGLAGARGGRRSMEDAACVLDLEDLRICGLFDGMGGARTANVAARALAPALAAALDRSEDPEAAMREAFADLQASLRRLDPPLSCGATATAAAISPDEVVVGWLGDSPAWLFREAAEGVEALLLTPPHHPGRADEAARILRSGGAIRRESRMLENGEEAPWGPLRLHVPGRSGGVAVSRALGLFSRSPALGGEPETIRWTRRAGELYLVLASDGLFEVLTPAQAFEIASGRPAPQEAAEAILAAALRAGAPDNVSLILVDLRGRRGAGTEC